VKGQLCAIEREFYWEAMYVTGGHEQSFIKF